MPFARAPRQTDLLVIVCSCNVLTDKELRRAARELQSGPERSVVTPGAVFRALGKRPRCGGCFKTIIPMIHEEAPEDDAAPQDKGKPDNEG
ncbi:bacterioferritin-associated ferredoxin [Stappia sp.]|uniref:(2Fe-2S)-binding protein n=1 Tax=Stappia sp. TaxID=1870903 RepID=UPI0025EE6DD1|nr:(2Fe-2S)-binding protein [Stappia sp.]